MLDNALKLLVRGGRDVRHALAMLVPEAWERNEGSWNEGLREFYRYHSALLKPWDGPAGIVFTDGLLVGDALDRNGLRPLRYAVVEDGLVVCSSEAGAIPLPDGARGETREARAGADSRCRPGAGGGLQDNRAIKQYLAVRRAYGAWNAAGLRRLSAGRAGRAARGRSHSPPGGGRLHTRGARGRPAPDGRARARAHVVHG